MQSRPTGIPKQCNCSSSGALPLITFQLGTGSYDFICAALIASLPRNLSRSNHREGFLHYATRDAWLRFKETIKLLSGQVKEDELQMAGKVREKCIACPQRNLIFGEASS